MKYDIIEINLKELREFIEICDKLGHKDVTKCSLVALKLRVQLLVLSNGFSTFSQFSNYFISNKEFQKKILREIIAQSSEFFRDAESWEYLITELTHRAITNKINILIYETGNYYDTITILLALINKNILDKCDITIVDLLNRKPNNVFENYTYKDIETGQLNLKSINWDINLLDYFTLNNKSYSFKLNETINIKRIERNQLEDSTESFDCVIARNITINYNLQAHEQLFNQYLSLTSKNGIIFTGNKERFKNFDGYYSLFFERKNIPLYIKHE